MSTKIRSPICTVVGHVDHGKSTLLDYIRGTTIALKEPGGITQSIGASIVPRHVIEKIASNILKMLKFELRIPSILFIDTPGHEAFTNMRKRGGNLADIAIVVVDITEGFKPQTYEAVEILKQYKTPFIVAANKIDKLPFWVSKENKPLLETLNEQAPATVQALENSLYTMVANLYDLGFESERFDRVKDFTKQIAIVPVSGITGDGVPELLALIAGLSQKFLKKNLEIDPDGDAKGTILEVKTVKGLGMVMDVIIYDGVIRKNDPIVIGALDKPIVTRVKALYQPKPLTEIRDEKAKVMLVQEVVAASGVRIAAPNIENVIAGMPIRTAKKVSVECVIKEIQEETSEVIFDKDEIGVVIKADSLGSLEALLKMLRDNKIPVKSTGIGNINKRDVAIAESVSEKEPIYGAILGFNVELDKNLNYDQDKVVIMVNKVIYQLIEDYLIWKENKIVEIEKQKLASLSPIGKFTILPGYIFRQSNPAIVGVEILGGEIRTGAKILTSSGRVVGVIKSIKNEKQENITSAKKGMKVPIAIEGVIIGRQIKPNDILYCNITEHEFLRYKEARRFLVDEEIEILKEIAKIKRQGNPTWGI